MDHRAKYCAILGPSFFFEIYQNQQNVRVLRNTQTIGLFGFRIFQEIVWSKYCAILRPMVQVLRKTRTLCWLSYISKKTMVQVLRNICPYGPSIAQYSDHRAFRLALFSINPMVQVLRNIRPYGPSIAQYSVLWSKYCAILGPMVQVLPNTWSYGPSIAQYSDRRAVRLSLFSTNPLVQVLRNTWPNGPSIAQYSVIWSKSCAIFGPSGF